LKGGNYAFLFGFIALLESGMHMPIMKTIYYGMFFWEAIDLFFKSILKELSINSNVSFSFWIIVLYLSMYAIWGMLLGLWIGVLPQKITLRSKEILNDFKNISPSNNSKNISNSKRKWQFFGIAFTLFFLLIILYLSGESKTTAIYVVLRPIIIILFIFYVLTPLTKLIIRNISNKHHNKIKSITDEFPTLKNNIVPAYQLAIKNNTGIRKYSAFILILIIVSLYHE
jgi:hypothetical protein